MIDRIVPQTTEEDRAAVAAAIGVNDAWPVITEPFTQWVIEDNFPLGRPAWDAAGASLVNDVAPFEAMKLKMLNASHSMLAFLGSLAGAETVAEAMGEPILAGFIRAFMDEDVPPVLSLPPGADVARLRRLASRAVSQSDAEAPPRSKSRRTARKKSRSDSSARRANVCSAGCRWEGWPMASPASSATPRASTSAAGRSCSTTRSRRRLCSRLLAAGPGLGEKVKAALAFESIFGRDLPFDPHFTGPVLAAYRALAELGVREALHQASAR